MSHGLANDGARSDASSLLDDLEGALARRRRAVVSASLIAPVVVATVAAAVLPWRSRTTDLGFWLELWTGHVLTVALGLSAVLLSIVAVAWSIDFVLWGCAGASLVAAVTCLPALGYHDGHGQHVGPAPWLALGGFLACAAVAVLWEIDSNRRDSRLASHRQERLAAEERVRDMLERDAPAE